MRCISMGFFAEEDQPVIWRGPMLHKALEQFLTDVYWDDPDFLLVDLPPGTGDISISLAQFLPNAEVYIVTTPQPAAQKVAQRAAFMSQKVNLDGEGRHREHVVVHRRRRQALRDLRRRWRQRAGPAARDPAARPGAARPAAAAGRRRRPPDRRGRPRQRGRAAPSPPSPSGSTSSWPPPAATTPSSSSSDTPFLRAVISRNGENRTQNRVLRTIPRHAGRHRWRGPAVLRRRRVRRSNRPTRRWSSGRRSCCSTADPASTTRASGPTSTASPTPTRWCTSTTGDRGAATLVTTRAGGTSTPGPTTSSGSATRWRSSARWCSGNSFGGFVAIHYAARHPDHPRRWCCRARWPAATPRCRPPASRRSAAREARACYERIFVDGDLSAGGVGRVHRDVPAALQRAALAVRPPPHVDEPAGARPLQRRVHRAGPARRPRRRSAARRSCSSARTTR